jgi:hypothetical protein
MSVDNGIYVLLTETEKGPEYRVSYSHSIGNIYGEWNAEKALYEGNLSAIKETFGESQVFHTLGEAIDFAETLEYDIGETEDGICVIKDFKDYGYIFE